MKDIVEESRTFAKEMAEKYEVPFLPFLTELIVKKGEVVAEKLNASKKIVIVGCYLIDIALGKSLKEGGDHVKMGEEISKKFLEKFDLTSQERSKILNTIEAHHGQVKPSCIESEIVMNVDNFKFLDPTGVMIYLFYHPKDRTFQQSVEILKKKVEEKYSLVTLDICKKEADENYKIIMEFLKKVV